MDPYPLFSNHPGYLVSKLEPEPGQEFRAAYKVVGPKKTWFLHRNRPNPQLLFVVPGDGVRGQMKIRGWEWFTDKNGKVEPVR